MGAAVVLRLPGSPRRLRAVAVSLVVHAVALAALALGWRAAPRPAPAEEALPVEIVASAPSRPVPASPKTSPRAGAEPAAPPPEAASAPPEPPPLRPPAKQKKETEKENAKKPPDSPRPAVPSAPAASAAAEAGADALGSDRGTAPAGGNDSSIQSLDLLDAGQSWYRDAVVTALTRAWMRPILDGLRETLEVTVAFEIQRDGSVRRVQVVASSGVPALDRSALRAVYDASPLPPLPPTWHAQSVPARFVFRLHPEGP